jgi:hypothetical protein
MKLSQVVDSTLTESRFFKVISEEGEGPRLSFGYDSQHDDHPDILLLGQYQHPDTGNDLVGGVNLHYLSATDFKELTKNLPQIMNGKNLYQRYHIGRRLVPNAFDTAYRTYNAEKVRGATASTLFPKYGWLDSAKKYFKKMMGAFRKSKKELEQENQPQYPSDLGDLTSRLSAALAPVSPEEQEFNQDIDSDIQLSAQADGEMTPTQPMSMQDLGQTMKANAQANAVELLEPDVGPDPLAVSPQPSQPSPQPQIAPQRPQPSVRQPVARRAPPQPAFTPLQQASPEEIPLPQFQPVREPIPEPLIDPLDDEDGDGLLEFYLASDTLLENYYGRPRETELYRKLFELRPYFAQVAQQVYDSWQPDPVEGDPEIGAGGICDQISEAINEVLAAADIDTTSGGQDGDDHAYIIAYDDNEAYAVDIPFSLYETGGGYNWTKIENVSFTEDDIQIAEIQRPDWIDEESDFGNDMW